VKTPKESNWNPLVEGKISNVKESREKVQVEVKVEVEGKC
jgi:hypothetical protein